MVRSSISCMLASNGRKIMQKNSEGKSYSNMNYIKIRRFLKNMKILIMSLVAIKISSIVWSSRCRKLNSMALRPDFSFHKSTSNCNYSKLRRLNLKTNF